MNKCWFFKIPALIIFILGLTFFFVFFPSSFDNFTFAEDGFSDLKKGDKYYDSIEFLHQKGIIHGYPDGTFQPERPVNRAEVLKIVFLARKPHFFQIKGSSATPEVTLINNSEATAEVNPIFPDVSHDSWFSPYVHIAKDKEIIHGTPDGKYYPERTVNKAEFLKILMKTDNPMSSYTYIKENPFADVPRRGVWFTTYFELAKFLNILNPDSEGNIRPADTLTRGEVAEIISKYIQAFEKKQNSVVTYYGARFHGRGTASGEKFDMNGMTAAHKTLPFNTFIRFTNPDNGKSIVVRINDRGPYAAGKDFDLSRAAFEHLAPLSRGVMSLDWRFVTQEEAMQ